MAEPWIWINFSPIDMATFKSTAASLLAKRAINKDRSWISQPEATQLKVLQSLMSEAKDTAFGKDHHFDEIHNFSDLKKHVPIRDYEALRPYMDRVVDGEADVVWPGRPTYFAKTSGTTSGAKFIPLSKASVPFHVKAASHALFAHIVNSGNADFINGKMIFLQGSPKLDDIHGVATGRLSGITAHFTPSYLKKNRLPSWEANIIEDWEEKLDAIVKETVHEDMTLIAGIPPWVQMYFERLLEVTGKQTIAEVFPNLALFVTGGVAYEPYKARFEALLGKKVDTLQTYAASEGFIAYQDQADSEDMLLALDNGIAYEFIPADQFFDESPPRLSIAAVEIGVNYAVIMHTNAGLWGYSIGDTVAFVSLEPCRLKVTGRIKHFISAFGEHVIGSEVEHAMRLAAKAFGGVVKEFTVAPQVLPEAGLPYHEWLIAFDKQPADLAAYALALDKALCEKNSYYKDLIVGGVLRTCVVTPLTTDAFIHYMKSIGKLGGQNKVPRLTNDRAIVDALSAYKV